MQKNLIGFLISVLIAWSLPLQASLIVQDIRIQGLSHIDEGTVFNYLPFHVGQHFSEEQSQKIVEALYQTGFFARVDLQVEGTTLILSVVERPVIASLTVEGANTIRKDQVLSNLKTIGLANGRIFNPGLLERATRELERQYFSVGKYGVKVETEINTLERDRVAIAINIDEGDAAKIREITFVGNKAYSVKTLKGLMKISTPWMLSFITKDDQYSKAKLAADLEAVRNFYLDRGYLKMNLTSVQVRLSEDKASVYVTIHLEEGSLYRVAALQLEGDWKVPESEIRELITVKAGEPFSRANVAKMIENIRSRLGKEGYAFADIDLVPVPHEDTKTTDLRFVCRPGNRYYARRIIFKGNERTKDEVLRREMTQLESAPLSTVEIEESRTKLNRTGYFSQVEVETKPVPNTTDQVDIEFEIAEAMSGNIGGGIGYSDAEGLLFNANLSNRNFLGSGNHVSLNFNHSKSYTTYTLSYENPYYTPEGMSRGFDLFYSSTEVSKTSSIADFVVDVTGGNLNYSYPISRESRVSFGVGYQNNKLLTDIARAPVQIVRFLAGHGMRRFDEFTVNLGWMRSSLDKYIFPEKGRQTSVDMAASAPFSDIVYYTIGMRDRAFYPLPGGLVLINNWQLGYGAGYGKSEVLPFFKQYYAGGARSVRGFEENNLGPRDSTGRPFGGNVVLVTNLEIALPNWFSDGMPSTRTSLFIDCGQVWDTRSGHRLRETHNPQGLRFSTGASLTWMSPLAPLVFTLGTPLNRAQGESKQVFSFSFGTMF